jgi:prophage tail gpP-like protein
MDYEFSISMVEPTDAWSMTRQYEDREWKVCALDEELSIAIDGTTQINGFIDDREWDDVLGTMHIAGRCKGGRLVQESIPTTAGFDGLTLVDAAKKLADPWFKTVTLSDARNRAVRRGKGGRASAQGEPAIFNVHGKLDEEHSGRVEPGETRWNVLEQLTSSIQIGVWSSADGRELVLGKPNYQQDVQFLFQRTARFSNVNNIRLKESVRDRYAMIEAHGAGPGSDEDAGDVTIDHIGIALDGPNPDGTGRDFKHPKRLAMMHRAIADNAEAQRAAEREMNRRNFSRRQITVEAPLHGQRFRSNVLTLFAPNTLARVVSDKHNLDAVFLIYACTFRASREGESSVLHLVPRGTVFTS